MSIEILVTRHCGDPWN